MSTVTIDPETACEYAIKVSDGAAPQSTTPSQTWYPGRKLLVGYTSWWSVEVAVDGGVDWVAAEGADVTVTDADDGGDSDTGDERPAALDRIDWSFDRFVDAVDDLGVDPTGETPVDGAVRDAVADGTCIEFPPGTYRWTEEHDYYDRTNVGFRSTTGNPDDVTFVFPEGFDSAFLAIRDGSTNVLLEGFEVAQTPDRETGAAIVVRVADGAEIHNLTFSGFSPSHEPSNQLYTTVETVDGVGRIDGVTIDGGGVIDTYPNRMTGIFGGTPHVGELRIRNCDIRELGSSGIRYTGGTGAVKVEDCYFENIDNGALRIHGNDHDGGKQSWVKRCEFVNDDELVEHLPDDENYQNADMIRADGAGNAYSGLLVEDCTFEHRSDPDGTFSRGCICRPGWGNHGGMTVRGCTMRIDANGPEAVDAGASSDDASNAVTIEDTHVTGSLSSTGSGALIHIGGSPGSTVRDCCIDTPNAETGVLVEHSDDCTIESSAIAVAGEPVVSKECTVATSGLSSTADCRRPGENGSNSSGETHTLRITGTGTPTNYQFTVSGALSSSTLESWDDITDGTAEGWVTDPSDVDTFEFSGTVTDFEFLEGEATVERDGEQVDPASL